MPLRLLVADDNEVVRIGLHTLLSKKHGWLICGEATNGEEAIEKVMELAPDVLILDLTMPIMNGFEAAAHIRRMSPCTKIIFLSVHQVPSTTREIGADAFVSKSNAAEDLIHAIERVIGPSGQALANPDPV